MQVGAKFLRGCILPELCNKVKWFHSGMTDQFREDEMHALIIGESFGDGLTDVAGMVRLTISRVDCRLTYQ